MTEPAWKRLGLKLKAKAVIDNDPLAIVTNRENGESKGKDADTDAKKKEKKDKKEKKKRKRDVDLDEEKKEKKPAKRVKLPKSERIQQRKEKIEKHELEKDQLQYLRLFVEDRPNWKFSKQKQNWIIKNIRDIPEDYKDMLFKYLDGIQGGSRDRIMGDMKRVVETWNKMVDDAEEQIKKDLEKDGEDEKKDEDENKEENDEKDKKEKKEKKKKSQPEAVKESPPDYDYAVLAREIHSLLGGEKLVLKSVDEEEEKEGKDGEVVVTVVESSVDLA